MDKISSGDPRTYQGDRTMEDHKKTDSLTSAGESNYWQCLNPEKKARERGGG